MKTLTVTAILFLTVAALGTSWLTGAFGDSGRISSADEAGVVCPNTLAGLTLVTDGDEPQVHPVGDLFRLTCEFVLNPSSTVLVTVNVIWTESGSNDVLARRCGYPPTSNVGFFMADGSYYGFTGESRADYSGRGRFANAMQGLAARLASTAGSISEPCPDPEPVVIPGEGGEGNGNPGDGSDPLTLPPSGPSGVTDFPGFSAPSVSRIVEGDGSEVDDPSSGGFGPGNSDSADQSANGGSGDGRNGTGGQPTDGIGGANGDGGSSDGSTGLTGVAGEIGTVEPGSGQVTGNQSRRPTVQVPPGSCIVEGRVTDVRGIVVPLVQMSIHDIAGNLLGTTATDHAGNYGFSQPVLTGGSVVLTPTDSGHGQRVFRIFAEQEPVTLKRLLNRVGVNGGICEANFDLWNLDDSYLAEDSDIDRWPAIIELYQNFNQAAELAIQLDAPLDYGLPVPVYAWCDSPSLFCDESGTAEFAFYSGSTAGRRVTNPYIALGFPTSELTYRGTPDNREYHEFGHAFLADVSNDEIAIAAGDSNHGGYYRNLKTTDSFVEGFAEFYSVMVSKHVDRVASPQRYRIGAEYDIEADRKPWEAVGWWEEFTLAGLLLDFEDGPGDYAPPPTELEVDSVATLNTGGDSFAIGRARNLGNKVAHSPEVTVQLLDESNNVVFTQTTTVRPETLGPGQSGVFYVAAPEGVEFNEAGASAGRVPGADDDEIDLDLEDLMRVVTSNWGTGRNRITTIEELYVALTDAFAGKDVNDDGAIDATRAQIDDIFINHGFFEDLNGDREFSAGPDGSIGGTSHPAATVAKLDFPAILPRSSAVAHDGSFVSIDASGEEADLLVQVELSGGRASYAYWTKDGTSGPTELAVPSAESDRSAVTVIAIADGRDPKVAYRTTARQFHAAVDSGEIGSEPVKASVELQRGAPLALLGSPTDGGSTGSGNGIGFGGGNVLGQELPAWVFAIPVMLAILMLSGGIYVMRRITKETEEMFVEQAVDIVDDSTPEDDVIEDELAA